MAHGDRSGLIQRPSRARAVDGRQEFLPNVIAVSHRGPELALRLAVGARPSQVVGMVLWEGERLVLGGIVVGAAASLLVTRFLSQLLFQVDPRDPRTFAAVVALLSTVTMLACYVAARRATAIDTMAALRSE